VAAHSASLPGATPAGAWAGTPPPPLRSRARTLFMPDPHPQELVIQSVNQEEEEEEEEVVRGIELDSERWGRRRMAFPVHRGMSCL